MSQQFFVFFNVSGQNDGSDFSESRMIDHPEPSIGSRSVIDQVAKTGSVAAQTPESYKFEQIDDQTKTIF